MFLSALQGVQRAGARAILRPLHTVSFAVLEAEAHLTPIEQRLTRKTAAHLVTLLAAPETNPIAKCLHTKTEGRNFWSPLQQLRHTRGKPLENRRSVQTNTEYPWTAPTRWSPVKILGNAEQAIEWVQQVQHRLDERPIFYTDGSVQNQRAGAAVIEQQQHCFHLVAKETIGWAATCSPECTELWTIWQALQHIQERTPLPARAWILTDSQNAVQHIRQPAKRQEGQSILRQIVIGITYLEQQRCIVRVAWIPGHKGIAGNEQAHQEARTTTQATSQVTTNQTYRIRDRRLLQKLVQKAIDRQYQNRPKPPFGKYTWRLDEALPGPHAMRIYSTNTSAQAAILLQCRSNHTYLHEYLARIKRRESAQCECGLGVETVAHVIMQFPRWTVLEKE